MRDRKILDQILRSIDENVKVYYQPPDEYKMTYPCLRYEPSDIRQFPADNRQNYRAVRLYSLTYLTHKPDDAYVDLLLAGLSEHNIAFGVEREFVSAGLYHTLLNVWW